MAILNETLFEQHIADYLSHSDLYNQRTSAQFDIENLCDHEMLERFLRQQPATWKKLSTFYPGAETDAVIAEYNKLINRGENMLRLLHKGVTIKGAKVKFVQFKPVLDGEGSEPYRLYRANCFSVVRQMRYSTAAADGRNELDLCILINGLPLMTFELKNEGTNQNFGNAIYQYRYDRNPQNRMLRNCLVHFAMDNNFAFMTTCLNGEHTRFLPFNQDSTNPAVEGDYPTCYMWQQILQADSLLDIIENFIKRCKNEKGEVVTIFPRFHQLRAVRKLRRLVREEGPGHNYLIQHSAGSGKTKSMAWLAHQLANMTHADRSPIFDCIIMVTDRIVLNRNMADDVLAFETVVGTVKDIRRGSKNLATALNEGNRIIISTVQKFAFALPLLKREKERKYAIIVDEAHTAIGNESAKDLVNALSTDRDLQSIDDYDPASFDSELDALMAYMQVMRRQMSHLSYFAFTATPKDKTYALFGTADGKAHDLYSMKQAIDEKFILDVLKYYKSYTTMFELIAKNPDEDRDRLFEQKKSLRVIFGHLNQNHYIMMRKADIMLEHFMHSTINKIGHRAKAMVVCDSRKAAADYKQILDRLIAANYGGAIKTLVAFSGEVEDSNGRRCSEANMNDDHVTDDDIRLKFMDDDYKLLIVAEKFQTGFDQPLLHTMYVDRMLGGIQCIQTLSRLNRCCPGKDDTMVIDFRNDVDKVQRSFQAYYTETTLVGEVDTQRIYSMMTEIEDWNIFSTDEVDRVVAALVHKETTVGVPSILKRIVDERVVPLSASDKDRYRKLVGRYVRQYGFMAQLMDFTDPDLEKFYVFCKVFYKYLPYTQEVLPMEILDLIDLDKLRLQMSFDGMLQLDDEEQELKSARIGEIGQKKPDEEKSIIEILDMANSPFAGFLNENDKILKQIWDEVLEDPEVHDAFMANNTYDNLMTLVREKFNIKVCEQIDKYMNLQEVLEKERSLSLTLIHKFVDALAQRAAQSRQLTYDEASLKDRIYEALRADFEAVCHYMRSLREMVDYLFYVLNNESLPTLDGVDDLVKNALNNLYTNEQLNKMDRRVYFNSLLSKYEAYLRKLYFLINNEELPQATLSNGNRAADGLANALHAFPGLWGLKNSSNEAYKKFSNYLEALRKWRNQEAHLAPNASDDEVNEAVKVVSCMYLFVTGTVITDLESAGYDVESATSGADDSAGFEAATAGSDEVTDTEQATAAEVPTHAPAIGYQFDDDELPMGAAADTTGVAHLPEAERLAILKECLTEMLTPKGKKAVFSKQRYWESLYRVAADLGFVIDGEYGYFVKVIRDLSLPELPTPQVEVLERLNQGTYALPLESWSSDGLEGLKLKEFEDLKRFAAAFRVVVYRKLDLYC